jgi:hypothetical protein
MITMTERGGFCRIIAPTHRDFNAEVRKLFPQAEIGTSDGQHTLTRIRIPSGLRGALAELIDKYYTLDGEVRPYVTPDWDYMDSVTPEPQNSQSYYEAWKSRQGVYGRPQETIWGEAAERAQDVLNEKRFSSEWERVMEAYVRAQANRRADGRQWPPPPYTRRPYDEPGSYAPPVDTTMTAAHRVLGVIPGAHHSVIRAAYRALAGIYHPDKPGGSTEKMQQLNKAFDEVKKIERMAS